MTDEAFDALMDAHVRWLLSTTLAPPPEESAESARIYEEFRLAALRHLCRLRGNAGPLPPGIAPR